MNDSTSEVLTTSLAVPLPTRILSLNQISASVISRSSRISESMSFVFTLLTTRPITTNV